jgi:hypothetical protein
MNWSKQVIRDDEDSGSGWAPGYTSLDPIRPPLFSQEELFATFLAIEEAGPGTPYFNYEMTPRVFSRQAGKAAPPEHLPKRADGSFAGYADRIRRELNTKHYCLRLTEMHAHAPPVVWERLCRLLQPFAKTLGEQSRCVKTTVFVGHYEYTPFGVHVDPYPQIQCVTTGDRSALFWKSDYWAPPLTTEDRLAPYDHLATADRIAMSSGDAVYWDANVEHAFSSSGGFAIALTISFPELPQPDSEIEKLRRASAHHFLHVPPAAPAPSLSASTRFRGNPLFPLACRENTLIGGGSVLELDGLPFSALRSFTDRVIQTTTAFGAFGVDDVAKDLEIGEDDARAVVDALIASHCVVANGGE